MSARRQPHASVPSITITDHAVRQAIRLSKKTGIVGAVERWRMEDRARRGAHPGGRPQRISIEAVLVAMVITVMHDMPQLVTTYVEILFRCISADMRDVLGVPDPPSLADRRAWRALYRVVRSRVHDLLGPIDPSPFPKNRRYSPDDLERATRRNRERHQLTDEELDERHRRLTWVVNRMIEVSLGEIPQATRDQWSGSAAVDATRVAAFAREERVKQGRRRDDREVITCSADPDAGLYVRATDDEPGIPRAKRPLREHEWAYEATLVVAGNDDPRHDHAFPNVVVGMAPLHKPATAVGDNAIIVLRSIVERGHPTGWLAGDRAYTNCVADHFQLPARALGYSLVIDYKKTQLGIRESFKGFKLVEGTWYCTELPDALAEATIDYRAGRIDEPTWKARLEARRAYAARPHQMPDAQGHVRLQCPASGTSPTAGCPLKMDSINRAPTKARIEVSAEVASNPPPSCTQQTVTIPPEAGAKFLQPLPYGSPEWAMRYGTLRNAVEGYNGLVKDGGHTALADASRRRIRGVAAQSVFVALGVFATNLRQIRSFLASAVTDSAGMLRKKRRPRRTTRSLQEWSPRTLARSGAPPS